MEEELVNKFNSLDISKNYKPFLKWVGGKTDIINDVFEKFPRSINNYYEPFVGGGSVFLKLLEKIDTGNITLRGNIFISDKNEVLINLYSFIKDDVDNLMKKTDEILSHYLMAKEIIYPPRFKYILNTKDNIEDVIIKGKSYIYYHYRNLYNETTDKMLKSVLFLFLNKTCFRGLFREGKNGFNTPYGNYKNPSFYKKDNFLHLSKIFRKHNVSFKHQDFSDLKDFNNSDFLYLDPPYFPINEKSFLAYTNDKFDHDKLLEFCVYLKKNEIKFLHSNSNSSFNNENYKQFNISKIVCKRRINSKNPEKTVEELFIWN